MANAAHISIDYAVAGVAANDRNLAIPAHILVHALATSPTVPASSSS